jgi:hypothetical protein
MHAKLVLGFILMLLVASCAPATAPEVEIQIVNVHASPAVQPWLANVYACASEGVVVRVADDPTSADIFLRLGEPEFVSAFAYQIGTEEILVVTHRQSLVQNMAIEEVRELFSGQGDPSVTVWIYPSGDDVQKVFEQAVMQGRSVTSQARLAVSPGHMSDTLNNEPNTIGILPRHWKAGNVRSVYTIPDIPVLTVMREEPQGAIQEIIACTQK